MKRGLQIIDGASKCFGEVSSYMLLGLLVLVFMNVLLRYVFNAPSKWIPELSQFVFAAAFMLGGAVTLLKRGHVSVDVFIERLAPRKQAILNLVSSSLFWLFCGVLLYQAVTAAYLSVSNWQTSATFWDPPIWPLKIVVVLAVLLVLLQGGAKFIRDWYVATGKRLE